MSSIRSSSEWCCRTHDAYNHWKDLAMMFDSHATIQFWGEAVNAAVYLHQRLQIEGRKRSDCNGYQAPYEIPYEMLHGFGKPRHNVKGNNISYQASLHTLRQFRWYASRLIPEVPRQGIFSPRSKLCMMPGYTPDSKTLWRIWDPKFQKVKTQSKVVFDWESNAHMSPQHGSNEIDNFELPDDEKYVEETATGDEPPRASQRSMQIGKRSSSRMHQAPDDEAGNADSRRVRQENQTSQRSAADADNITLGQRLHRENQTARRSATAMKISNPMPPPAPAPPIVNHVTRSQGEASAEAQTASEATGDPFTYAESMESPQGNQWKRAIEEESTLILLKNTYSALYPRKQGNCKLSQLARRGFIRLNGILRGWQSRKRG